MVPLVVNVPTTFYRSSLHSLGSDLEAFSHHLASVAARLAGPHRRTDQWHGGGVPLVLTTPTAASPPVEVG